MKTRTKNRITVKIAIASLLTLGAAGMAHAQRAGNVTGGQVIPQPSGSLGNGYNPASFPGIGQGIPQPSGALGNGFNSGFQTFGQITQNMGFNPFSTQMSSTGFNSFFNGSVNPFSTAFGLAQANGYYGGYYGFGDPSFAIGPNGGITPLGNGYNGYTGGGYNNPSDWQILQSTYAQGYQDAINAANQSAANQQAPADNYPTGMTATPRGAVSRVPHGADGVKMWRVGNQVALRWQGDARVAASVTFSVTDRSGRTLRSTTVDQLPAEVHFTPPAGAAFYQAVVHYVDGASNTIMGQLPR